MRDAERHLNHWVDLVDHLLRRPGDGFPIALLLAELASTFGTNAAWSRVEVDGSFSSEIHDCPSGWSSAEAAAMWTPETMPEHPLLRWFAATGDHAAMSAGRVPDTIASEIGRGLVVEIMRPFGLDEQLAVPYRSSGLAQEALVLATTGADYTDGQVDLARRIQPLVVLLARNHAVLDPRGAGATVVPLQRAASGLTGRELAVLDLLAEGLTAESMGRRLGVSRHTVRKHHEHVYRKLGVTDRLVAVREARERGLLDEPFESPAGDRGAPTFRQP